MRPNFLNIVSSYSRDLVELDIDLAIIKALINGKNQLFYYLFE